MQTNIEAQLAAWIRTRPPKLDQLPILFTEVSDIYSEMKFFWTTIQNMSAPGSLLAIADWTVPGSLLHGKKARLQRRAGSWVNVWRRYMGMGDGRALSAVEWRQQLQLNGWELLREHVFPQTYTLSDWTSELPQERIIRGRALLLHAPAPVVDHLTPQLEGDKIAFQLNMIFLLCVRR